MTKETRNQYQIGDRIPDTRLPAVEEEGVTPIRGGARESVVLVFPHGGGCAECRAYVERLTRAHEGFRRWDARLTVVLPDDAKAGPDAGGGAKAGPDGGGGAWSGLDHVSLVRDEEDALHAGLDEEGGAGVLVADRWGAVYEVVRVGAGHGLPTAHELVEWLRFIATQCPECGVPDTPGLTTWS